MLLSELMCALVVLHNCAVGLGRWYSLRLECHPSPLNVRCPRTPTAHFAISNSAVSPSQMSPDTKPSLTNAPMIPHPTPTLRVSPIFVLFLLSHSCSFWCASQRVLSRQGQGVSCLWRCHTRVHSVPLTHSTLLLRFVTEDLLRLLSNVQISL